jgi:Na+/proline symporter
MFLSLGTHGTDQMMVQRYLSASSAREAGRALVASGFVVMIQFSLFLLLGIALACFYDALQPDRAFATGDHVFATFIVRELPVGLVGIVLAAVFAAAMSTLSSSLNSSTTSAVNDLIEPMVGKTLSTGMLLSLSRGLTIVFGLIQIVIGIAAANLSTSVVSDALAIAGFSAGLLLGLFALGILTPRVDQASALWGFVAGLIVLIGLKFGLPVINETWEIAWPWFSVVGALTTFGVAVCLSLSVPTNPNS